MSYSWFQTSQTGGQWYNDTSPFSIPWLCHNAEGRILFIIIKNVIMLSVALYLLLKLNVIMLNVILLSVIMLNVLEPCESVAP